jgi:hypothetical protein
MRLALKRHPDTRCDAVTAIGVDVARRRTGALVLSYEAIGNIDGLHLPLVTTPTRTDDLWRHTCFEVFIRPAVAATYFEPVGGLPLRRLSQHYAHSRDRRAARRDKIFPWFFHAAGRS